MDIKVVRLEDFLLPDEMEKSAYVYLCLKNTGKYVPIIDAEIVTPNLDRITLALGRSCTSREIACLIEMMMYSRFSGQPVTGTVEGTSGYQIGYLMQMVGLSLLGRLASKLLNAVCL